MSRRSTRVRNRPNYEDLDDKIINTLCMTENGEDFIPTNPKKKKRKKADHIDNILEKLRKRPLPYNPFLNKEYEELVDLTERHTSHLPSKLQPAVAEAKYIAESPGTCRTTRERVRFYYSCFCALTESFLDGKPYLIDQAYTERAGWQGASIDTDTKDQLELVLRLVPHLFMEGMKGMRRDSDYFKLTGTFMNFTKAVRFVPFLLKMYNEIYPEPLDSNKLTNFSMQMLNNVSESMAIEYSDATPERDEESLRVFCLMAEEGFCQESVVCNILSWRLLSRMISSSRTFGFIERRLRIVINVSPSVLKMKSEDGRSSFLTMFALNKITNEVLDPRFYDLMLELGTMYFPSDLLGLGFHGNNFRTACTTFGKEFVQQAINDKITGFLAKNTDKNDTLLSWVVKAASDESIDLDGLYTLIRYDPSIAQVGNIKEGTNKQR